MNRGTHNKNAVELAIVKVFRVDEIFDECALSCARLPNDDGEEVRLQVLGLLLGQQYSLLEFALVVLDQLNLLQLLSHLIFAVVLHKHIVRRSHGSGSPFLLTHLPGECSAVLE